MPQRKPFLWTLLAMLQLFTCREVPTATPPPMLELSADQVIPTDDKVPVYLQLADGGDTLQLDARAERRGGFSISFPKHSYEIDLKDDVALLGLPADDDWILNASHIDKTFLRHKLAYNLFREMNPDNRAPGCRELELTFNGEYRGLYLLMQKPDRSLFEVKKSDPGAVIFKEPHVFRKDLTGIEGHKPGNFHHQTYPDADRNGLLDSLREELLGASPDEALALARDRFDLTNLLDWHLLLLVSNNSDGILKNFYLYRQRAGEPLRVAPWDYDHSFGRDGDNERNLDTRPLDIDRSLLFSKLLRQPRYRQLLADRWDELNRRGLLSVEGLSDRIRQMAAAVREAALRNAEVWPYDDPLYYDANDFDAEVALMLEFIRIRDQRLRPYFAGLTD